MNIMHIDRWKDFYYALPPEKRAEILAATLAYMDKYFKTGNLKQSYSLDDGRSVVIWNFASDEERYRVTNENPALGYLDMQSVPFIDSQQYVQIAKQAAEAGKKAAKE